MIGCEGWRLKRSVLHLCGFSPWQGEEFVRCREIPVLASCSIGMADYRLDAIHPKPRRDDSIAGKVVYHFPLV